MVGGGGGGGGPVVGGPDWTRVAVEFPARPQLRGYPCSTRFPFPAGLRLGPQRPAGRGSERPVKGGSSRAGPRHRPPHVGPAAPSPPPARRSRALAWGGALPGPAGCGRGRPFSGLAPGCSAPRGFPGTSRGARLAVRPRPGVSSAALSARPGLGQGQLDAPRTRALGPRCVLRSRRAWARFPAGPRRGGGRLWASVGIWGGGQQSRRWGAEPEKRPRPARDLGHPRTSSRQPAAGIAPQSPGSAPVRLPRAPGAAGSPDAASRQRHRPHAPPELARGQGFGMDGTHLGNAPAVHARRRAAVSWGWRWVRKRCVLLSPNVACVIKRKP